MSSSKRGDESRPLSRHASPLPANQRHFTVSTDDRAESAPTAKERDERHLLATIPRYVRCGVRSTQEALTYLRRHGVSVNRAERLVSAYHAQGWLDDRASARLWAEQWARRGYATATIRLKLSAKGFDERLIDETIQQRCPASDDEARARAVLAQHMRRHTARPARARLARALASRGFDSDVIERILNESLGPSPSDA